MNEERLAKALSGNEGLLSALAGKQAGAERVTADRTLVSHAHWPT